MSISVRRSRIRAQPQAPRPRRRPGWLKRRTSDEIARAEQRNTDAGPDKTNPTRPEGDEARRTRRRTTSGATRGSRSTSGLREFCASTASHRLGCGEAQVPPSLPEPITQTLARLQDTTSVCMGIDPGPPTGSPSALTGSPSQRSFTWWLSRRVVSHKRQWRTFGDSVSTI
jgi:hypothetical protein